MKLQISLGQIDIALGQPERNLDRVRALASEAADAGSDVLVLPELWSTGYALEQAPQLATELSEGVFADINQLARQHRLHIVGSCLSVMAEQQFGNTLTWVAADGATLAKYSKLHLFRLMEEEKFLTAGESPTVAATPWGAAGLSICYDLRFPELFRSYALSGAEMIFLPAEWPHPRLAHWRTLLRARAIENQLFVVACNRVGESKGTKFCGHSCIIDPWGETVIEADESEAVFTAQIDTAQVGEIRKKIPVFDDRRPEVYGSD